MANTDRPHGFDPYGAVWGLNKYVADKTVTTAIFRGDLVASLATGYIGAATTAGSDYLIGASVSYVAARTATGSTEYDVMVLDDPDQVFFAQTVTGTAPTRTIINSMCNHVAGAGSAVTMISGHELGISTTATTQLGMRLLDFVRAEDNDTTVEHAQMVCVMNEAIKHTIAKGI